MATPKTIVLKGGGLRKEGEAGAVITPGFLLARSANTVIPHGVAAGNAAKMFAVENDVIGDEIDVDYASGENVVYIIPEPGSEIYALVAAGAAAIVDGDFVESAGDGTVRKHVPQGVDEGGVATYNVIPGPLVGQAVEDVDNSGGTGTARIRIEVL